MRHEDDRISRAIEKANALFSEGYDCIVGLIKKWGQVFPWVFTSPEELRNLAIEPKYPMAKFVHSLAKKYPDKRIGLIGRGCDERALKRLDEIHMVDRKKIGIVRIRCTEEEAVKCNCEKPVYDLEKCVGCWKCVEKCEEGAISVINPCPILVDNKFDLNLGKRKAVYVPFPQAVPLKYVRDPEYCLKLKNELDCKGCKEICEAEAVLDEDKEKEIELTVGAIVVATGYDMLDPHSKPEYSYNGKNVITGLEFERLCSASGPTGGEIKVSGKKPKNVVFIQCVGSREKNKDNGNTYCSRVCCMYTAKQAHLIRDKLPDANVTIFYTDVRAFGKGFEEFYTRVQSEGVKYLRRELEDPIQVVPDGNGSVAVKAKGHPDINADLVVLATAIVPRDNAKEMARVLNISQSADGFLLEAHPKLRPLETFTSGIFLAGCCQSPKDIPDTVAQASGAAAEACALLSKKTLTIEGAIAVVDADKCSLCLTCVLVCPYKVPVINYTNKTAEIEPAKCQGCGICASECPAKAIQLQHYKDAQVIAACDALATEYGV